MWHYDCHQVCFSLAVTNTNNLHQMLEVQLGVLSITGFLVQQF